jgi:cyclase
MVLVAAPLAAKESFDVALEGDLDRMTAMVVEDPEVVQVSGPIYRIRFPFGDVSNIGLSVGDDGVLLVDTGFSARAVEKLREAMSSLGDGELKMIVNTHLHPDHIAGNSIGGDGVKIIDFNNLDQMAADGVLAPGRGPIEGKSGRSFAVYSTMTFNGEEIRLIPYPGIHTDTDLLVHFTRSGVVHIGDLLILQSFPSVSRRAEDYLEFLKTVVDVFPESTRFICGHGREGTIADVAEYHRELSAAAEIIKDSLARGKTKRAILEETALQPYESWGEFIPVLNTEYWFNAVAADFKEDTDFTDVTGPWLGQEPPGMQPEVFLPEVMSHGERGVCSGFLDNGTVFVFKQLSPKTDWKFEPVYFIEFENGKWTDPVVAPFSDLFPYNFTVAPDGKALYFASLNTRRHFSIASR